MSKKIVSKLKRPHCPAVPRIPHRSSSVGSDCDKAFSTLGRSSQHSQESLDVQLKRLELINDDLHRHLSRMEESSMTERPLPRHRQPLLQPPPGPLLDLDLLHDTDEPSSNRIQHQQRLLTSPTKQYNDIHFDAQPARTTSVTFFGGVAPRAANNTDRQSQSSDNSSSSSSAQLRIGVDLFNRRPECGVDFLLTSGAASTDDELAALLVRKRGFSKVRLFQFLTDRKNRALHQCFCRRLDLRMKTIPEAIQQYIRHVPLTGEYSVMLDTVEVLSDAYCRQHPEDSVMGLHRDQISTVMQFLLTFSANERNRPSGEPAMSRESFMNLLQKSLASDESRGGGGGISRQLASCLFVEVIESPFQGSHDEKLSTLKRVCDTLADLPHDFVQHHRYVICQVDLLLIGALLPQEKPSMRERTVFLFNDVLVVAKKSWSHDSQGHTHKVKQVVSLNQLKVVMVTYAAQRHRQQAAQVSAAGRSRIVQLSSSLSGEVLMSFCSKLDEDLEAFLTSLEHALAVDSLVEEQSRLFQQEASRVLPSPSPSSAAACSP